MLNIIKTFLLLSAFLFGAGFGSFATQQKFLKPEEAFNVTAVKNSENIHATITLGDKIHIYSKSLHFNVTQPKQFELKGLKRPTPVVLDGEKVLYGQIVIDIPTKLIESQVEGSYTLSIEFEGCSDSGICYQPQKRSFDFVASANRATVASAQTTQLKSNKDAEVVTATSSNSTTDAGVFDKIGSLTEESNSAKIADVLGSENSIFIVLLFFIFGLLLALTPCVFPMIPILSSIIVSQSSEGKTTTGQAFFTSLIYVLSMAVTYTVVGLVAGLLGADIQSAMQNPWVLTIFAAIFVALAFSLFGYYEIGLPASIQSKLTKVSDDAQGKGILGTAIMGLLSALIVGPCVAPPLGGAILFISHTGDALLGGTALFVMSMGMGMPLLLVGIGAGKFMPKPGGWMSRVSQVFGIMMLALAIFMLARILPDSVTLVLWAMLFIGTALYLGLFDGKNTESFASYLGKLFAILSLIYGSMLFVGGVSGATSLLRPLAPFVTTSGVAVSSAIPKDTANHKGYTIARLLKEVAASNKPVVVDFGKESCTACKELEEFTFPDPKVQEELKNFTFIKIDLTNNTKADKEILAKYELFGTPNIIFFDTNNNYLRESTLTGFIKPEIFAEHLKAVAQK